MRDETFSCSYIHQSSRIEESFYPRIPAHVSEAFPHQQRSALQPSHLQLIYHRPVWTFYLIFSHFSPLKDAINYTCRQSFHPFELRFFSQCLFD